MTTVSRERRCCSTYVRLVSCPFHDKNINRTFRTVFKIVLESIKSAFFCTSCKKVQILCPRVPFSELSAKKVLFHIFGMMQFS